MYSCAINISKDKAGESNCFGTNIGYRGICTNCYNYLVKVGIIADGDKFSDFPEWLQELIRNQDSYDHIEDRHPLENYSETEENHILGNNKGRKLPQMLSCV